MKTWTRLFVLTCIIITSCFKLENKRVGISCHAREFGVLLAVYEFVISKDKKIISILEVGSLWDKPNQMVTNNCKRNEQKHE